MEPPSPILTDRNAEADMYSDDPLSDCIIIIFSEKAGTSTKMPDVCCYHPFWYPVS